MGQIGARTWSGGQRASTRETLMLVFLVDRARSTVDREGVPEALDIGKYILEYRYIIFRSIERRIENMPALAYFQFSTIIRVIDIITM